MLVMWRDASGRPTGVRHEPMSGRGALVRVCSAGCTGTGRSVARKNRSTPTSLGRRHVLEGQWGLGTSELFRSQIVLRRCLGTPGSQHITHVMTGPVGCMGTTPYRGMIPREGSTFAGVSGPWEGTGWGARNDALICRPPLPCLYGPVVWSGQFLSSSMAKERTHKAGYSLQSH